MTAGPAPGPTVLPDLFDAPFVRDPHPGLEKLRRTTPVRHDPATGLWLDSGKPRRRTPAA
ncbi:hypothetical protein ACWD4J_18675 [Streptomyces sp. NPDC002577]